MHFDIYRADFVSLQFEASFCVMGSLQRYALLACRPSMLKNGALPTANERHAQQRKEKKHNLEVGPLLTARNPPVEKASLVEPGLHSFTISFLTMAVEYQA